MKKTPTVKKDPSLTFDSVCELAEKPTLIGKLVVNLLGVLGAGNGRCLVSPTLPRIGTRTEGEFAVAGYTVRLDTDELSLGVMLSPEGSDTTLTLVGPRMPVSRSTRESLLYAKNLPDPAPQLLALYQPNETEREEYAELIQRSIHDLLVNGGQVVLMQNRCVLNPNRTSVEAVERERDEQKELT